MEIKSFLENYGFSQVAIERLIKKGKYDAPYGMVEIKGNELITTYHSTGEVKKETIA
jgi:hypothetical protein